MKRITGKLMVCAAVATAVSALAQDQARPEGRTEGRPEGRMERRPEGGGVRGGMMAGGGFDQSMLLLRIIDDPETAKAINLTAVQREALQKGTKALDDRMTVVSESLRVASLEQAALAAKVMADKQAVTNELMVLVQKIGGLRTEQATIQTEKLIVIRDTLSAEQIRAASAAAQKRMEEIRARMVQRGGERGGERGARGGDRRATPLPQRPEGWDE